MWAMSRMSSREFQKEIVTKVNGKAQIMTMPEFKQLVDEVKREVREVSVDDLRQMQARGEDFSLIDVREREDWYQGIIPGAQTITRGTLELKIDLVTTDKDRKIVLYCGGGSRSALSAYMLQRMGFRNVLSLAGGYGAWQRSEQG
jgi:rhodanese-related sulfurtransferase